MANGGDPPARRIFGQASLLSRTIHDVRYNEVDDEIVVSRGLTDDDRVLLVPPIDGLSLPLVALDGRSKPKIGGDSANKAPVDLEAKPDSAKAKSDSAKAKLDSAKPDSAKAGAPRS